MSWLFKNWCLYGPQHLNLAPDDGGGGGGNEEGDDEPRYSEKEFQAKINEVVQKRLAKSSRELREKDKAIADAKGEIDSLKTQITELQEALAASQGGDKDKMKGEIELLQKQYDRQISALQQSLDQEKQARERAELARKQGERDRLLDEALTSARCLDMKAGRRFFGPQIEWDDLDQKWMFKTEKGNLVEIADGVAEEMPDYLKPPVMGSGGSGSQSGSPRVAAKRAELEKLRKDLESAKRKVSQSPNDNTLVLTVTQLKKKIQQLESEIGS
jgi:chromosome segregation ATPase